MGKNTLANVDTSIKIWLKISLKSNLKTIQSILIELNNRRFNNTIICSKARVIIFIGPYKRGIYNYVL